MKVYSLLTLGLLTFSCFGQYDKNVATQRPKSSLSARWKRALEANERRMPTDNEAILSATKGLMIGGFGRYLTGPFIPPTALVGVSGAILLKYYDSNVMTPKRVKAFKERTSVYDYFTLGDSY